MKQLPASFLKVPVVIAILVVFLFSLNPLPASAHSSISNQGPLIKTHITPLLEPSSAPCYGSNCYGMDPYASGCAYASWWNYIYFRSADLPNNMVGGSAGTIYNYYSTWCNANWAQYTDYSSPGRSVRIWIAGSGQKQCYPDCDTNFYGGTAYPAWTNMIDGTNITSAVALQTEGEGGGTTPANL